MADGCFIGYSKEHLQIRMEVALSPYSPPLPFLSPVFRSLSSHLFQHLSLSLRSRSSLFQLGVLPQRILG